jgi:hypothetical protein
MPSIHVTQDPQHKRLLGEQDHDSNKSPEAATAQKRLTRDGRSELWRASAISYPSFAQTRLRGLLLDHLQGDSGWNQCREILKPDEPDTRRPSSNA